MTATHNFRQRGNTVRLLAEPFISTTLPMSTVRSLASEGQPPSRDAVITNLGPGLALVGFGRTAAEAATNAAVPQRGDSAGKLCHVMPPGTQRCVETDERMFVAAVTISGEADLFVTPGYGAYGGGVSFAAAASSSTTAAASDAETARLDEIALNLKRIERLLAVGFDLDPEIVNPPHSLAA